MLDGNRDDYLHMHRPFFLFIFFCTQHLYMRRTVSLPINLFNAQKFQAGGLFCPAAGVAFTRHRLTPLTTTTTKNRHPTDCLYKSFRSLRFPFIHFFPLFSGKAPHFINESPPLFNAFNSWNCCFG